jgi:peptidoglycan/xylan/chitin deacetylase (PgdA/CDA1 family)
MSIRRRLGIRTRLRSVVHRIWPPNPKPLILLYHRIAEDPIDHWGLAVSPARFEEHLCVLRRTRHPFPLSEFVRGLLADTLPADAVALTFDDGYVDNLIAGKPRLVAEDVPATVFLATGYIDRPEAFWWDELAKLILFDLGPQSFKIAIGEGTMQFDFGAGSPAREHGATATASLTSRREALWTLRQALLPLDDETRRQIMVKLRSIFIGRDHRASLGRAMTGEEVRTLVADGLMTIGAHTVTHPVLSGLGAAACLREVTESKFACEALIGASVEAFAYPYGDHDAKACEAVKSAGFAFACSVKRAPAIAKSDVFALPRIYIPNLGGDEFERTLRSASSAH